MQQILQKVFEAYIDSMNIEGIRPLQEQGEEYIQEDGSKESLQEQSEIRTQEDHREYARGDYVATIPTRKSSRISKPPLRYDQFGGSECDSKVKKRAVHVTLKKKKTA